jgi:hypothetical protein
MDTWGGWPEHVRSPFVDVEHGYVHSRGARSMDEFFMDDFFEKKWDKARIRQRPMPG